MEVTGTAVGTIAPTTQASLVVATPTASNLATWLGQPELSHMVESHRQLMGLYDEACRQLVGPNDVVHTERGEIKKKSAWRKLARHFGVSWHLVSVEAGWDEPDPDTGVRHYKARVVAEARSPWGQVVQAVGGSATREARYWDSGPFCPECTTPMWDNRGRHQGFKCKSKACAHRVKADHFAAASLRERRPNWAAFGSAEHDVVATAATRAVNRAVSDLIAAGELSEEERSADVGGHSELPPQVADYNGMVTALGITPDEEAAVWAAVPQVPDQQHEWGADHYTTVVELLRHHGRRVVDRALAPEPESAPESPDPAERVGAHVGAETAQELPESPAAEDDSTQDAPTPTRTELMGRISEAAGILELSLYDALGTMYPETKTAAQLTVPQLVVLADELDAQVQELLP